MSVHKLRPFFGYFGGKWRDAVKNYPAPKYQTIVEPFAGSAGYSLRYADHRVVLCELDPVIAAVWRYLTSVSAAEILAIPDIPSGSTVDDLKVCEEAKWLVGLWLNRATAYPRKSPSRWMRDGIRPGSFWGERVRRTIATQLQYIRHWEVHNCSYQAAPVHEPATWFIDPPYMEAGRHYRFGAAQLDFDELASWCQARPGEAIVCENEGATWLPFRHLGSFKTTRTNQLSKEVRWLSEWEHGEVQDPVDKRDAA